MCHGHSRLMANGSTESNLCKGSNREFADLVGKQGRLGIDPQCKISVAVTQVRANTGYQPAVTSGTGACVR